MKIISVVMFDKRQEACAVELERRGYVVKRIANQAQLDRAFPMAAMVLPVRGVNEQQEITMPSGEVLHFHRFLTMQESCVVFAGIPNKAIDAWHLPTIYLMEEETVIEENALLTAQGVLATIFQHIDQGIRELSVDVIGYGHCGRYIVEFLVGLGMKVRVVRRDVKSCHSLYQTISLEEWSRSTVVSDIVINTAPAKIIEAKQLHLWKHRPLLIDIASKPGGIDEIACQNYGVKLVIVPSLPPIYTPVSAGKIFARAIEKEMNTLE